MARCGITTGSCAAAAAYAAAYLHKHAVFLPTVSLRLPSGQNLSVPILAGGQEGDCCWASVRKDAGDDPDVTHGMEIGVQVRVMPGEPQVNFRAGPGVGVVTRPGLSVPLGEPAINPTPRKMISEMLYAIDVANWDVEVFAVGGEDVAKKTFNPRLGVVGGISILGTTGIVRPYCRKAMQDAIRVNLQMLRAEGVSTPILVAGNIGYRAALELGYSASSLVELGNEWGAGLAAAKALGFPSLVIVGHPGKLVKLAQGQWYTHSAAGSSAIEWLQGQSWQMSWQVPQSATVEGYLRSLSVEEAEKMCDKICHHVIQACVTYSGIADIQVHLVDMASRPFGKEWCV